MGMPFTAGCLIATLASSARRDVCVDGTDIAVSQHKDEGSRFDTETAKCRILAAIATVICAQVKEANVEAQVHIALPPG